MLKSLILLIVLTVSAQSFSATDFALETAESWHVHELDFQDVADCIDALPDNSESLESCRLIESLPSVSLSSYTFKPLPFKSVKN